MSNSKALSKEKNPVCLNKKLAIGLVLMIVTALVVSIIVLSKENLDLKDKVNQQKEYREYYNSHHTFNDDHAWFAIGDSFYYYNISRIYMTNESYNQWMEWGEKDSFYPPWLNVSYLKIVEERWWDDMVKD